DFEKHRGYIHDDPVAHRLVDRAMEYRYCSAYPGFKLDGLPSAAKAAVAESANRHEWNSCPFRSHSSYAPTGSRATLSFLSPTLEGKLYAECRGSRAPLACSTYRRLVSTPTKLADELPLSPSGSKHLRQSHCAPTTGNCTKLASLGVW